MAKKFPIAPKHPERICWELGLKQPARQQKPHIKLTLVKD